MSSKASKRVNFSPDVNEKPTMFLKHGSGTRVARNRKRVVVGIFGFRLLRSSRSRFSPASDLLRRLGAKVARVIRLVSLRGKSSSRKVSSASLARSRSLADALDSQRAEAIEDCIVFLNSSSSYLQRSNSVSTNS